MSDATHLLRLKTSGSWAIFRYLGFWPSNFLGHRDLINCIYCSMMNNKLENKLNTARKLFPRRQWHPTPVPLPGKSHGRRSLVGCSPWGRYQSDTTERLHFHFSLSCIGEGNGNPLQCSCLENPRDGEPGGLPSMGSHRVGHNWSDLAAAAAESFLNDLHKSLELKNKRFYYKMWVTK